MLSFDVLEQAAAPGTHMAEPVQFIRTISRTLAETTTELAKRGSFRHGAHGESPHESASHAIRALGVFVLPCRRITRRGGQHIHVVTLGDLLSKQSASMLAARAEFSAVSRCDEGELHGNARRSGTVRGN
jgi:hypothetical protein